MRTKYCTKLGEEQCRNTEEVIITRNGNVYLNSRKLTPAEKDAFAHEDGFRHEDDHTRTAGCFAIMFRWWNQMHDLPFCGDVIYW